MDIRLLAPKKLTIIALFLFGWLGLGCTVVAEHAQEHLYQSEPYASPFNISVGYVEFPPFEFTNEKGEADGFFIDMTRKVLLQAGYSSTFVALPISRVYLYLQEGNIDLWPGLAQVPSLQGHVYESNSTPMHITLCAWHIKNSPSIKSVDELKDRPIILVNGYTYGGLLYKLTDPHAGFNVAFTPNHVSGLNMLSKNRGDYFLNYLEPVKLVLSQFPKNEFVYSMLNTRKGAFIVSKKTPYADKLIRDIDASYDTLIKSGAIREYQPPSGPELD